MFGIGGSSSRANSQSSSLDFGVNTSQSFSDSLAQSLSRSAGQSTSVQNVWNADVLKQLYAGALSALPNTDLFAGQAAELYGAGTSILDTLGVGAGEDYLSGRLTDTTARDEQLGALKTGLGDLFREELNPAITSHAVATGTLGGGRQGVAQAQAIKGIAKQYATGAADIIGRDQLARDTAAGTLIAGKNQAASTGFAGLDSLLGIGVAGLGAPLSPYSALAQILGGPTVLTQGQSTESSEATSEQVARAISEALGFNYGTSQSTSSNKSASFNFGL